MFRWQTLLLWSTLCEASLSTVSIPKPDNIFNVQLTTAELVDHGRMDPYAPTPQPRALMISLFLPASCNETTSVDYMPPATAAFVDEEYSVYGLPSGTFERLRLEVCSPEPRSQKDDCEDDQIPIALFSPAVGTSRLLYNAIAQAVAAKGIAVVTIDHPYDADIVEFPDGRIVLGASVTTAANNSTEADILLALKTRAQDVSFVLDQLATRAVAADLVPGRRRGFDVRRVAMYGHSLGGATTAEAMLRDGRIVGGLNLDGGFYGAVVKQGLSRPFMLFGHTNETQATDPSWAAIWPHLRGWKLELELARSQHNTFTDFPLLLEVLGLTELAKAAEPLIGSLGGKRVLTIIKSYTFAFLEFALGGKEGKILKGPLSGYPEVSFVAEGQAL